VDNRAILPETSNEVPESEDTEQRGEGQDAGQPGDRNGIDGGTGMKSGSGIGTEKYVYDIPKTPGLIPPVRVSRIEPKYPETARKLHLEGIVVLQAVIDNAGRVIDLRVVKSAGDLLDAATIAAVEKWIYQPATLNGRTVNVFLNVTVDFKLH
jgi:protein TonB